MLAEIYIEALLVDQELADKVWEAWDAGVITDEVGGGRAESAERSTCR